MIHGAGGLRNNKFELVFLAGLVNVDLIAAVHRSAVRLAEYCFNLLQSQLLQLSST
ncbi:hypothetical protein D3C87_1995590 [compost metagenome]